MGKEQVQINETSLNFLLYQTSFDSTKAKRMLKNLPPNIIEVVEENRQYRFDLLMKCLPDYVLMMIKENRLPWPQLTLQEMEGNNNG